MAEPSINLDITFCRATKCPAELKKKCGRCELRITEYLAAAEVDTLWRPISMADFSRDLPPTLPGVAPKCDMFINPRT